MKPVATYSFLPWLRQGIANTIKAPDGAGGGARGSTHVALQLDGTPSAGGANLTAPLAQEIALYGPGDVVGIDPRAVVRTEPRNWITNFEANYLAAIDFYDEDFPWRYTPAAPDASRLRLRPWITLVVLTDAEFAEGRDITGRPAPYITIPDRSVLPKGEDLWAWAHVHVNDSLSGAPGEIVSPDTAAVLGRLQSIRSANPDDAYARLLCPRRLADHTHYHAFVIPTFETGRLAGIGEDPSTVGVATASAWAAPGGTRPDELPYYHRWEFSTGAHGDFEYLVRLLKPQPVDPRVGVRAMDVQDPGSELPGITEKPELGGILRLGGALQVPLQDLQGRDRTDHDNYETWDQPFPDTFQKALAGFVDLPDDYAAQATDAANQAAGQGSDSDPLITAPLYGRWHALIQRLLTERDGTPAPNPANWVHRLNLDPRFRVPAAFGAQVVEANAEQYMQYAWEQIGDVLAANARIRRLHLAGEVANRWFEKHLSPLVATRAERAFALLAPVQARIVDTGATITYARSTSRVVPALTATAMRRLLRPGGRLMRKLAFTPDISADGLLARVNRDALSAAPPRAVPAGLTTVDQAAAAAIPSGEPASLVALLARYPWLPYALVALGVLLLVVLAVVLPFVIGLIIGLVILGALIAFARRLLSWEAEAAPAISLTEADQTPASIATLPDNPAFTISRPGSGGGATPTGTTDSAVAARFKVALADSYALLEASRTVGSRPAPTAVDLARLTQAAVTGVDPKVTIPRRGFATIQLPDWINADLVEDFDEVMAYPRIDLPMYRPLKKISAELFLPNINLIAQNSITLVETNQRFIEAYMVGLNHEFARKLLWREYPTDQRGSPFRQFWDAGGAINWEGLSTDALRESLYDIAELHRWPLTSALGTHNNRSSSGEAGKEEVVLVIRGELLKRYPNAVIYAQRAKWEKLKPDGSPDLTVGRGLVDIPDADPTDHDVVRFPLYEAKADPDITFFGFDLTVDEAAGGTGVPPDIDPGWFFVIKQRPGEPRFGLELTNDETPETIDDLTWNDAVPGLPGGGWLPAGALAAEPLTAATSTDPDELAAKQAQRADDVKALAAPESAARWAYILFRAPVMVAIHADQMLKAVH